jgi:hypothetical protein
MAERDGWEKAESVCKSAAALLIPMVIGVAGFFANGHLEGQKHALERDKLDHQMWTRATEVVFFSKEKEQLFGNETSLESRRLYRSHWLDTYNQYAKVKLSEDFIAAMMEQDTRASEKRVVKASDKPERQADQQGDGWVSVGRLPATRYADQNFEIASDVTSAGAIKPGTMIRARWSVNLRANYDNTEEHERKINPVLGLMQAGECAKVLESKAKIRGQTWAYVDVVPCPVAMLNAQDARG